MAQFELYIDVLSQDLVMGTSDPRQAPAPPLVQADTPMLRVYLLTRNLKFPIVAPQYTVLNNAGLTLQMVLGLKVANTTTIYTQQLTWTASADRTYFEATLPMSTAAITSALGSSSSIAAYLEVKYTQSGVQTTVLSKQVTIQAGVAKGVVTDPLPPGATPISFEYSEATYIKRQVTGGIVIQNASGTKKMLWYLDDDGAEHKDMIS